VLIVAIVGGLTAINLIGVRSSALVSDAFTIGKLLPLLLLVLVGMFFVAPARLALAGAPDPRSFSRAVLLLVYAFTGFEAVVIASGEMRDPQRNLPWAMLTAIGIVTVVYLGVQVVCIGTLPGLATSERPLTEAGARVLGAGGAALIAAGALISILGTLNGIALLAPRLPFAMAERGDLPPLFAATHPRFRTPWVAILVSSAVMLAFTLAGSFLRALTISTIIRLLTFIITCAGLVALRRPGAPPAAFRAPAGPALVAVALAACVWLVASSGLNEARDAAIAALLGAPVYLAWRARRRRTRAREVQRAE